MIFFFLRYPSGITSRTELAVLFPGTLAEK
jgi:hypothetical protein